MSTKHFRFQLPIYRFNIKESRYLFATQDVYSSYLIGPRPFLTMHAKVLTMSIHIHYLSNLINLFTICIEADDSLVLCIPKYILNWVNVRQFEVITQFVWPSSDNIVGVCELYNV